MNLKEACQFLDLPENAPTTQLVSRYEEKKSFFEMLHANAPNAIIKNLQVNNLKKLEEIAAILPDSFATKGNKNQNKAEQHYKEDSNLEPKTAFSSSTAKEPLALLVVHTENKPTRSFPLFDGENSIGRNEHPSHPSILITDDSYVSRLHCAIIVKNNFGELSAAIIDDGRINNGKPSLNGCYFNGEPERIKIKKISEGDTIQIGMTKLVFKWKLSSNKEIEEQVEMSEFIGTIVINI